MIKRSGIYVIVNIVTNDFYVGSSLNLYARTKKHEIDLTNKLHYNPRLQHGIKLYGIHNFIFAIVEFVNNKYSLLEREQYWIDYYEPEYNICREAYSPLGVKRSWKTRLKLSLHFRGKPSHNKGIPMKESSKKKLSLHNKKHPTNYWKGKSRSQETKDKISKKLKGNIPWNKGKYGYKMPPCSEERKRKISIANKGRIITPEWKEKISKNFFKKGHVPWAKGKPWTEERRIKTLATWKKNRIERDKNKINASPM